MKISKIIVLLSMFILLGCGSDDVEDIINEYNVSLSIYLVDTHYKNLLNKGGFHEFKIGDPKIPIGSELGKGGILVVHSLSPANESELFSSYDLYCTYEKNIRIQAQDGGYLATCPNCKSEYDISNGLGLCTSGPNEGNSLEKYKTRYRGDFILVSNE